MRQQSSEGDDDGEGVFAGEEEKKRWSAPISMGERGDEVNTSSDCHVILVLECSFKGHIGEIGHV